MPGQGWFTLCIMSEEQDQKPEQQSEQQAEEPHHVVLNDRKTPQAGNPTVWLVLLAIPLALSLLVAVVRDYEPQRVERPAPLSEPKKPMMTTRMGHAVESERKFSITEGGYVAAEKSERAKPLKYKCDFSPWVGLKMQQKMLDMLKDASGNERPFRIIPPGAAVTEDYRPARVNFDLDEAGKITRIWCG